MPNRIASLFLAAALALAALPGPVPADTPPPPPPPVWPAPGGTNTGEAIAWDGDTINIDGQTIRLFGIDAPEMSGDPRGPVARGALDDILAPDRTGHLRGAGHGPPQAPCGPLPRRRPGYRRGDGAGRLGLRRLLTSPFRFSRSLYSRGQLRAPGAGDVRSDPGGVIAGQDHNLLAKLSYYSW